MTKSYGDELLAAAQSGVPAQFLEKLHDYREALKTPEHGVALINWLSIPANLTQVHAALTTKMGIQPRALAIRRLQVARGQKVMMLLQAMESAVKRTHGL